MFGALFLVTVGKYYQLKKNIGDYRIQQARVPNEDMTKNMYTKKYNSNPTMQHPQGGQQTYDNPAFSGFGMQDSYRTSRCCCITDTGHSKLV